MQRNTRAWVIASLASVSLLICMVARCEPKSPTTTVSVDDDTTTTTTVAHPIDRNTRPSGPELPSRCPDNRWIAKHSDNIDGWTRTALFSAPDDAARDSVQARFEAAMSTYGVYTSIAAVPTKESLDRVRRLPSAHQDCYIMPAAEPMAVTLASLEQAQGESPLADLACAFRANVGLPRGPIELNWKNPELPAPLDPCPYASTEHLVGSGSVTVAIIDNATHGKDDKQHGDVMKAIVETISPTVKIELYPKPTANDTEPSAYLSQSEVITNIGHALAALDKQPQLVEGAALDEVPNPRLIINLSLAWEPDENEAELYDAMVFVQRPDVLVFAAAGNTHPRTCNQQGLPLPAAWSTLVHGVSAVDEADQPLLTNRANTGLSALGRLVVVPHTPVADYYAPMTGTSASTAVVSAIAAGLWAREPGLEASSLIETLKDRSRPFTAQNPTTEEWVEGKVITACNAWDMSNLCPDQIDPDPTWKAMVKATLDEPDRKEIEHKSGPAAACETPKNIVTPQPSNSPCKDCILKPPSGTNDSTLSLMLAPEFTPSPAWVELAVHEGDPTKLETFIYYNLTLSNTTILDVIDTNHPSSPTYAYVTMYFAGSGAHGNEITVDN